MDEMDESSLPVNVRAHAGYARKTPVPSSPGAGTAVLGDELPSAPAPQRRRMVITHDQYIQLQNLVIFHLSDVERQTGRGIDRDELIDWYLEFKESQIQDVEQLEYEKELITKMLRKLVRVRVYLNRLSDWFNTFL